MQYNVARPVYSATFSATPLCKKKEEMSLFPATKANEAALLTSRSSWSPTGQMVKIVNTWNSNSNSNSNSRLEDYPSPRNNKQRQVSMFLILLFKLLTQLPFVSFLSISILSLLPSQSSLYSLSTIPYFSSDHFFVLLRSRLQISLHSVSPMAYFCISVSHHDIFF